MSSYVKTFNIQLCNFVQTLVNRFPESKELKLGLTGAETLRDHNPRKSIDFFVMYGYKYRDYIRNKDEAGLLSLNVEQEVAELKQSEDVLKVLDNLKNKVNVKDYENIDIMAYVLKYWNSLDESEKNNVWTYLQVLVALTDKYIADKLKTWN